MGKTSDQCGAVVSLELMEGTVIDDSPDHLPDVEGKVYVLWDEPVELLSVLAGRLRSLHRPSRLLRSGQSGHNVSQNLQGVVIILRDMVGHPRFTGVDLGAAELLRGDYLPGGGLHQGRPTQEDRSLVAYDHRLITHRRHIGTAGSAGSQYRCDLRDLLRGELRLVVEDAAEVVLIREDLILHRQEGSSGVDQIDAGQMVLLSDLLRAQMLLHRHWEIGAALDRGIVADNHDLAAVHQTDAGDDSGTGCLVVVHLMGGQGSDFQEGAALVQESVDPVPRQHPSAVDVPLAGSRRSAARDTVQMTSQLTDELPIGLRVRLKIRRMRVRMAQQRLHSRPSCHWCTQI